jgi:intein-encoded DNA endonuclease-like protein
MNTNNTLHPNSVRGFVDAEGCFTVKFCKSKSLKLDDLFNLFFR